MILSKISASKRIAVARRAFHTVFKSADPFDAPFQDTIKARALLFPSGYGLPDDQYVGVVAAAAKIGESSAFFSGIEGYDGSGFERRSHWELCLTMPFPHQQLLDQGWEGLIESALFSRQGTWGIISSHEQHAVVGGSTEFIEELGHHLDLDHQLQEFLNYWKHASDQNPRLITRWIPRVLAHIYGSALAREVLKGSGLE
jgi:hypothetical protein